MVQRAMRIRHEMALLYKRKYTSARAFITHFEVLLNMHDRLHYPMSDHQKSILLFQGLQCYSWSRTVNWHRKVIRGELTFERLMVLVKAAFPHLSSKVTETKRLSLRAPVVQSRPARMRPTQPMPQQQERTSRVTAFMNLKFTGCA
ncbi:hypothetical protein SEUCBS139899_010545 [Sporothrix eucalyptigena]|uniref:Uncharacterized protein n=1 Tax=Sporothrix eucalyptigena TaxID=1812306 RepID=A0ABP0BGC5_9PEZI